MLKRNKNVPREGRECKNLEFLGLFISSTFKDERGEPAQSSCPSLNISISNSLFTIVISMPSILILVESQ